MPETVLSIFLNVVSFSPHNNFQKCYCYFHLQMRNPKLRQVKHTQSLTAGKQQSAHSHFSLSGALYQPAP